MRYIDADKLIDDIRPFAEYDSNLSNKDWVRRFEIAIDAQPTADVVEVVRCKDCVYRPCLIMPHSYDFDYCSYGERGTHEKDN